MKTLLLALLLAFPCVGQCRSVVRYCIPERPVKASFCGDRVAYRHALSRYHRGVRLAQLRARAQVRRLYHQRCGPKIIRCMYPRFRVLSCRPLRAPRYCPQRLSRGHVRIIEAVR